MARSPRRRRSPPVNTASRFAKLGTDMSQTALRAGEMSLAAAQTIGYRTAMMAQAATDPAMVNHPEFTLMGSEKIEAGTSAGWAMAQGLGSLYEAWAAWVHAQTAGSTKAMTELAGCRTPADVLAVQQHWMNTSLSGAVVSGTKLAEAANRMMAAGLAPIHRAASANAKRLGRSAR